MSVVDDDYRVGQVHKINPNAKVLNDISIMARTISNNEPLECPGCIVQAL